MQPLSRDIYWMTFADAVAAARAVAYLALAEPGFRGTLGAGYVVEYEDYRLCNRDAERLLAFPECQPDPDPADGITPAGGWYIAHYTYRREPHAWTIWAKTQKAAVWQAEAIRDRERFNPQYTLVLALPNGGSQSVEVAK